VARPRVHSDDELLDRISQGLANASASWTLTEAARAAGVHPATLVKRFGGAWIDGVARPPQERARGVADFAMLLEDLKDDELSGLLSEGWECQITYLTALISGARADGHLSRSPEPRAAAVLLLDVVNGSCIRVAASAHPATTVIPQTLLHGLLESWT
jgi:hypothetical protein